MKLASLKQGGRDGTLIVASRDLAKAVRASDVATTLQAALEDWTNAAPRLNRVYELLNESNAETINGEAVFPLDMQALASPLPRAYEFVDGSAYLPHVERVRRARGAEVPKSFYTDPLMYQATSAGFLGPRDPVLVTSEDYGIDLEAEVVVVTDDVPMAVSPEHAAAHIQLIGLINDVSLRGLIPGELAKGFGFLQSKPRSALSPVFVTPDELGDAWRDSKLLLPMRTWINGNGSVKPNAAWICSSISRSSWRTRQKHDRCRPAVSLVPAPSPMKIPTRAHRAWQSSAPLKRCAMASRPRRFSNSAIACASKF